jgi:hypothetical protein
MSWFCFFLFFLFFSLSVPFFSLFCSLFFVFFFFFFLSPYFSCDYFYFSLDFACCFLLFSVFFLFLHSLLSTSTLYSVQQSLILTEVRALHSSQYRDHVGRDVQGHLGPPLPSCFELPLPR